MDWSELNISIAGLSAHYQRGDFTPSQLVEHLLTLDADNEHHIWIQRLDRQQLQPYLDKLDTPAATGLPLYGIPFAVKDNIDLADIDTTAACEAFRYRPVRHATVVERLIDAGAIPMGKTNLDQFATGLVGTRSPFGACRNAFNPAYISGGSSSGSAVATALGQVSFALGTDTAGSGRVPAAFNNLIGVKPSRGLISTSGVVPACRSLDCVSIFALSVDDANCVLSIAEGRDDTDPYSRVNPFDNGRRRYGVQRSAVTLGIPATDNLNFYGDKAASDLFDEAVDNLRGLGHAIVEVDIQPLLEAARLLYQGPWVSERYLAIQSLIESQPDSLLAEIDTIISQGRDFSAVESFRAQYQLQAYRQTSDQLFSQIDCLVTPTTPTCYSIDAVNRDPIELNSRLGTYTNFMNLLDLCGIALPAGFLPSGVGFGITLQAPAMHDRLLLSLSNQYCRAGNIRTGVNAVEPGNPELPTDPSMHDLDLVVCGAHLQGMPLNWQLTERHAILQSLTTTSADYRLYAMADGRPALIRDDQGGAPIEVEIWRIAKTEFGSFVADIPAPLGIGKVELADGRWLTSFIAEPRAVQGASEITSLGGWRHYKKKQQPTD